MSCHALEFVEGYVAELVMPVEQLGLRVVEAILFVFNHGRCGGAVLEALEVEVGDNWELSFDSWELRWMLGERCLIVLGDNWELSVRMLGERGLIVLGDNWELSVRMLGERCLIGRWEVTNPL